MAYQIQRKNKKIKETLELVNGAGEVVEALDVDLDIDQVAARVNKAYEVLGMAQNTLQKDSRSPEALEAYGKAVLAVFNVIFGEDGTEKLLTFYEGNTSEMLLDVFPFINEAIMPKIKAASEARRDQMIAAAKVQKRGIFRQ